MDSIAVLADQETLLGFRLAGVRKTFLAKEDADASLEEAINAPAQGILIVTQDVVEKASMKTRRKLEQMTKPVVVVVPSKTTKTLAGAESLAMLVKKAMGVDLLRGK